MMLPLTSLGLIILALAVPSSSVIQPYNICANITKTLTTPFSISFPGHPNTFTFPDRLSCHCRMTIQEPYTFVFVVKNFTTSTRDSIALKWNWGERQVISEAGKNTLNVTQEHLRDLTLSFMPAKPGYGTMLLDVDGERNPGRKIERMHLECQDQPFRQEVHNVCSNISKLIKTPFSLSSPGYPDPFPFSAGVSCHCRMYTLEPYGFSLLVKKFKTELRDGLALKWYDWNNSTGKKYVISDANQNVEDTRTNLKDLTLSFQPVKGGLGEFLIEVESDHIDVWKKRKFQVTMNLVCQDYPFTLETGVGEKKLHYIIFNAVPLGIMAFIGIIIIVPLLFLLCFGKAEKAGPHYKLGEVDPTIKVGGSPVPSSSLAQQEGKHMYKKHNEAMNTRL